MRNGFGCLDPHEKQVDMKNHRYQSNRIKEIQYIIENNFHVMREGALDTRRNYAIRPEVSRRLHETTLARF